jgi:hypothetical protein
VAVRQFLIGVPFVRYDSLRNLTNVLRQFGLPQQVLADGMAQIIVGTTIDQGDLNREEEKDENNAEFTQRADNQY